MNILNTPSARPATLIIPSDAPAAARSALKMLARLKHGTLNVKMPDGTVQRFGNGQSPTASLHLLNWNACSAALKSGDIGFAESYIAGDWTSPHMTELLRIFILNRKEIEDVIYGTWLGRLAYRVKHLLNRNTKTNSQKNIHAHYDLGNAFYQLWLDESMNYSSAVFDTPEVSMLEGQHAKVRRALQSVQLKPGQRVLEIGCGWGALAEKAVLEFDATVVGVTLSTEQLAWAEDRLKRQGIGDFADLRLQDYRDIGKTTKDQPFDAICSIEMVEAVGREYWPEYFRTVTRLLKPGGHACIQSIVIADELFDRYITSTDFIQQYIFPGGCLPCPREFRAQANAAGLEVIEEFSFGQDYARTLQIWRDAFKAKETEVMALGFDRRFMRIWEFYLCYCEAAFHEANTDVVQYTLRKL